MGSRTTKTPRKYSPGKASELAKIAAHGDRRCEHYDVTKAGFGKDKKKRCIKRATVFRSFRWRCDEHDPGPVALPGCGHGLTSPMHGVEICSYCGYTVES